MVDNILNGSVLSLQTTGAASFVVSGATCHSTLRLVINRQFQPFQGSALCNLQEHFSGGKVIIINEVSTMGRKILVQIEKLLRQDSVREDLPCGGFIFIIVRYFQ